MISKETMPSTKWLYARIKRNKRIRISCGVLWYCNCVLGINEKNRKNVSSKFWILHGKSIYMNELIKQECPVHAIT